MHLLQDNVTRAPLAEGPRVLHLLLDGADPSMLWRVLWPGDELQRGGYPVRWQLLGGYPDARDAALLLAAAPSQAPQAVVLPRTPALRWGPRGLAALTRFCAALRRLRRGVALLADYDDDWLTPHPLRTGGLSPSPAALREVERGCAEQAAVLRLCDGATVATAPLAEVVRRYARPGAPLRVAVAPNALDPGLYYGGEWRRSQRARESLTGPAVVGWAGGPQWGENVTLTGLAEAWTRIAARYPPERVRFRTVGEPPAALLGSVPEDRLDAVPSVPFREYPAALGELDIGCVPLADAPPNHAKSPQKCWELSLCGAVPVCSPTVYGDDPGYTEHGGLLADGVGQWEETLSRLVERPEERRERAAQLAAWVEREHTLAAQAHRWPAAWREIVPART